MHFTPYSEKDLPRQLLEKGEYDVEVLESTDVISKNTSAEMIKLNLAVWVGDKVRCRLFDYLLDAMPAKLRHACDTFGLLDKYQNGSLRAFDFEGRTGKAKIGIQSDKTGQYPDKNSIVDYVCRPAKQLSKEQPQKDDDLPF